MFFSFNDLTYECISPLLPEIPPIHSLICTSILVSLPFIFLLSSLYYFPIYLGSLTPLSLYSLNSFLYFFFTFIVFFVCLLDLFFLIYLSFLKANLLIEYHLILLLWLYFLFLFVLLLFSLLVFYSFQSNIIASCEKFIHNPKHKTKKESTKGKNSSFFCSLWTCMCLFIISVLKCLN